MSQAEDASEEDEDEEDVQKEGLDALPAGKELNLQNEARFV